MAHEDAKWVPVRVFLEEHPEVGRNLVYQQAKLGNLPTIKIGGKLLIRRDAFDLRLEKAQSPA